MTLLLRDNFICFTIIRVFVGLWTRPLGDVKLWVPTLQMLVQLGISPSFHWVDLMIMLFAKGGAANAAVASIALIGPHTLPVFLLLRLWIWDPPLVLRFAAGHLRVALHQICLTSLILYLLSAPMFFQFGTDAGKAWSHLVWLSLHTGYSAVMFLS